MAAQPIELILARNLIANLARPGVLIDADGFLIFFNNAAGALIGQSFEEIGQVQFDEWVKTFEPVGPGGEALPTEDDLPLRTEVREGHAAQGRFGFRMPHGDHVLMEVTAMPLVGQDGYHGALVLFDEVSRENGKPDTG